MRARATPRLIPERSTTLVVDLPGLGDHHFVVPSALRLATLARAVPIERVTAALGLLEASGLDPEELYRHAQSAGVELLQAAGALIGWAWHHETLDLEADPKLLLPLAYGEAVFEELHSAGYALPLVALMAMRLGSRAIEQSTISREAAERLGFFPAPKGANHSSSSKSTSPSSASSGPTPA